MKSLALVYASSLFSLCEDENKCEDVLKDLCAIYAILEENDDYVKLLDSPTLPVSQRLSFLDEAFLGCDEYVLNFIKILCEKKRVHLFFDCVNQYKKLFNKKNNIEAVTAITAVPLSDELKAKLVKKLENDLGKKVSIEYKTDKSLLGGIVIRTENSQTDASVRARLDAIRNSICSN